MEIEISEPLPSALGELKPMIQWWLTATNSTQPADAPRASAGDALSFLGASESDLLPTAGALCGLLTNRDAAEVTSTTYDGAGRIDHNAWMRQCALVRDEIARLRPMRSDAAALRTNVPDGIGDLVDKLCTDDGGPIVVDGPIAAAALLLAYEMNPESLERIRPLQSGSSRAEALTWEYLRIEPILPFATGYSDGQLLETGIVLINRALELASGH
jgi:nicotinate-nucleotide--dimethylbenzimidazole phosphoribosyltransferase